MITCKKCGEQKWVEEFYQNKKTDRRQYRRHICRDCERKTRALNGSGYRKKAIEKQRKAWRKESEKNKGVFKDLIKTPGEKVRELFEREPWMKEYSNSIIAERLGMSINAVNNHKVELGVEPYKDESLSEAIGEAFRKHIAPLIYKEKSSRKVAWKRGIGFDKPSNGNITIALKSKSDFKAWREKFYG